MIVFFLSAENPHQPAPKWYVVSPLCTVLVFFLVLLRYHVSEQLFGIRAAR